MGKLEFKKGKHYLIKTTDNKRFVRRFYKGCEKRFDSILCYVFSSKVSDKVRVEYKNDCFYITAPAGHFPAREISIPYYCIKEIKEAICIT